MAQFCCPPLAPVCAALTGGFDACLNTGASPRCDNILPRQLYFYVDAHWRSEVLKICAATNGRNAKATRLRPAERGSSACGAGQNQLFALWSNWRPFRATISGERNFEPSFGIGLRKISLPGPDDEIPLAVCWWAPKANLRFGAASEA